jgi:hypothetical protein
MIEMRWLSFESTKTFRRVTLQYRTYRSPPEMIGPKYPPGMYGWSEWKDVPMVNAGEVDEDDKV